MRLGVRLTLVIALARPRWPSRARQCFTVMSVVAGEDTPLTVAMSG
jgi:hypothetical protein